MIVPEIAPEVTITSLAKHGKGLCRSQVTAVFNSPCNNRKLYCTLECGIEKAWLLAVERNRQLQNRVKFRLDSVETCGGCVRLNLGFTTCKDYLGTNCKSLGDIMCWMSQGFNCYCDRAAYFANPLAVGAIVHTIDDKYIFLRRRKYCCLDVGYTDRVCGFICPQKAFLNPCSCRELQASAGLNDLIYDTILNFIESEMAIPLNYLGEPELLGLAQDRSRAWAPSLEFYVNSTLDSERIYFLYSRKQHSLACNSTCIILATWSEMCCMRAVPVPSFQESFEDKCAGPVAFQDPMAGNCDIDLKFRADIDLVEKFIPRNTPSYPPMNEPLCVDESMSGAFLLEKASGNVSPVHYSPCFESWKRGGYQRER